MRTEGEAVSRLHESVSIDEFPTQDFVLTPGPDLGTATLEYDGETSQEELAELDEAGRLGQVIPTRIQGHISDN